jgi:hypothetical protein
MREVFTCCLTVYLAIEAVVVGLFAWRWYIVTRAERQRDDRAEIPSHPRYQP